MFILDLVYNLTLLVALSTLSGFIDSRWRRGTCPGALLQGVLFGTTAVIGMLRPLVFEPGLIFDGRSVVISLCGLFFGPVAAAVAGLMAIACRFVQGGVGTVMGILVTLSSALIGIFFYHLQRHKKAEITTLHLLLFGIIVHIAMLAMAFSLPLPLALDVLKRIGLPVILTYPLATILLGKILSDQESRERFLDAVKEGEHTIRTLTENIPGALYRCSVDAPRRATHISEGVLGITGRPSRDFIEGRVHLEDIVVPEDRPYVLQVIETCSASMRPYAVEYRVRHTDGSQRWVHESGRCARSPENLPAHLDGVMLDITERRQAEEDLFRSRAELKAIYDHAPVMLCVMNEERKVLYANTAFSDFTGCREDELKGGRACGIFGCTHALDDPRGCGFGADCGECALRLAIEDTLKTGAGHQNIEHGSVWERDGKRRDITLLGSTALIPTAGPARLLLCLHDISELKRVEQALAEQADFNRRILNSADAQMAVLGPDGVIQAVNAAWERYASESGSGDGKVWGVGSSYFVPYEPSWGDVTSAREAYEGIRTVQSGLLSRFTLEYPCYEQGAGERWFVMNVLPLQGRAGSVLVSHTDISGRRKTEQELRRFSEEIGDLYNNAPCGYHSLDAEGTYLRVNDTMLRWLGYSREELIGRKTFGDVMTPESLEIFQRNYPVFKSRGWIRDVEYQMVRKDGSVMPVLLNAMAVRDASGNFVFSRASLFDDTERKRAEEVRRAMEDRLARAEKMESLGMLAGGVAHDLNNVLGVLVGFSELLAEEMGANDHLRSHVDYIRQGSERAAAIVQDLLTMARRGVQTREIVDLNALLEDLRESPEFEKICSFNPAVTVRIMRAAGLLPIKGSPVHLRKTITNLVSNAMEAMPAGGTLNLTTDNVYLDGPVPGYDEIQEGDYVVLSVADTGEGISDLDMKRIFEPFYTKKIMGRSGTGLGLAVVWGTVKDHRGYINVQSEEGKGSTFSLYFPVTREEVLKEGVSVPVTAYLGRGERILVVDDVQAQRALAVEMLTKLRYSVVSAASGEEALEYLKDHTVDLLILDMIMDPGMDGLEAYREILKHHPNQKAIIVSGFSESDRVRQAQVLGAGAYVRKPYVSEVLGIAVRNELGRPASRGG